MPRRLAHLLIFLNVALIYATTPTPDDPDASVKAVAVPHPNVFIPLKEWKQQRLQDLESRVRKAERKHASSKRKFSAIRKSSPRLLAFLLRHNVCLLSSSSTPSIPQSSSSSDEYWASGEHVYGHVNDSGGHNETIPLSVSRAPDPHVIQVSAKISDDPHVQEEAASPLVKPSPEPLQNDKPSYSAEPDELTGRSKDYVPNILPRVLPNGIPNVGDIVKSIKEVSLSYMDNNGSPSDSTNPKNTRKRNTTGNSTSLKTKETKSKETDKPTIKKDVSSMDTEARDDVPDSVFEDEHMLDAIVKHSNDSGVKEKPFNYASVDAGARVLAFSSGSVGAKNIIQGNDDKYLLSPCAGSGIAGSRFIDIELSEEVILESIETGNFEFYSSSPRKIAVLGASSYPPKNWNIFGIFNFENVRSLQRFQIKKRGVTRYLRVIFAGKQGTEFYCPISTIRAFGKNLLADWKELLEKPASTRKPSADANSGSKTRSEKDGDRTSADKPKTGKKHGAPSSDKQEECSDKNCDVRKRTSVTTSSEQSIPTTKHPAEEDQDEMRIGKDVKTTDIEGKEINADEQLETGPHVDNQDDDEERSGSGTDTEEQSEEGDHGPSDRTQENEEGNDEDEAHYSDHMSEDDQVVIDALRSDTLTPVDGDDNIFRKVTRMLRLLELNQTLTNQYIDTQLAKFAAALSDSHSTSRNVSERVDLIQRQVEIFIVRLENQVDELTKANFRRDILLCILVVCVAFLLGTHWILWSAVSGTRLNDASGSRRSSMDIETEKIERVLETDDFNHAALTRIDGISSEGPSPAGRKKKRKGKRPFAGENMNGGYPSPTKMPPVNGARSRIDGRSVSSLEISVSGRQRFGSGGGTFDVLRSTADQ